MSRRTHIIQQSSPLPDGYTQLKWLASTGVQVYNRIETDFQAENTFVIRGAVSYYSNLGSGGNGTLICGVYSGSNRQAAVSMFRYYVKELNATVLHIDSVFGNYAAGYPGAHVEDNTIDTDAIHTFEASRSVIAFDGISKSREYQSTNANNFAIFQCDTADPYNRYSKHKLYWLSISDIVTGDLLHYFLPAIRDADNKLGVYDTVGHKFYASIGTQWQYEI